MKKILSILLAVAMLMSLALTAFAAEDETPVVTVASTTAEVGEEVTVDVSITATTLAGYGLKVVYDKEALEITKITKGADAGEGFFSGSKKTGKVTYATTYNEDTEGVLFTVTFKVLAEGQHTVSLEIDSFGLDDQTTFEVTTVDGVISVGEEPVETPTIEDGVYYISYGDLTFAALAETYNYGYPDAGDVNNLTDTDYITITNVADGQFTMQDCYGRYIFMKGTYNSFNVSTDMPEEGHLWVLEAAEGGYYIKNVLKEKYLAYSEQYTSWGAYATISETSVLAITKVVEEGGEIEGGEGSIDVTTTDNYGWFDQYSMTAPATGTYTFYIPAGLGLWSMDSYMSWGNPEIDFYDNTEGFELVVDLTEGEVFEFLVGATTKDNWTITYTYTTSGEGGEGGEDPTPVLPDIYDLTIGNNSIDAADIGFRYTATENGTLVLNLGNSIMGPVEAVVTVNGANEQTLYTMSQITLDLVAGDEVLIIFTATGYATMTAEWKTEGGEPVECEHEYVDGVCIHCGEEDPNYVPTPSEPDGTQGNPFIIETLPFEAAQETTDDFYYQWTASEAGILYVYHADGMVSISGSSVASWEYAEGGKYIEVAAGDVITINYWSGTAFSVEFVPAGQIEIEYIILDSVENITVALNRGDKAYYKWTATEDGEITFSVTNYTWSATYLFLAEINGQWFNSGEIVLNVTAGDEVIFYFEAYSYAGDGSLTFSGVYTVVECEHEYVDGVCTKCGEADPNYVPECEHEYVDGVCTKCGEADPNYNPETGSLNVFAMALIAAMSVTAVVVTAKKRDEE